MVRAALQACRPYACEAAPFVCAQRMGEGLAVHAAGVPFNSCILIGNAQMCPRSLVHSSFVRGQTWGHGSARRQLAQWLCMIPVAARVQVSCCVHVRTEARVMHDSDSARSARASK